MQMRDDFDPLFGAEREEIRLTKAPLVRVLAQVRFTEIISIGKKEFIADFQEEIRKVYPRLQGDEVQVVIAEGVQPDIRQERVWRFYDGASVWRVSLSTNFVSLETVNYTSRSDFMARFGFVLEALARTIRPTHVSRLGVRYIDHIRKPELDAMDEMVRKQMLGLVTSDLRPRIRHAISETLCDVAEGQLLARWGFLPPQATHEPSLMPPVDGESWFLDLDVYGEHPGDSLTYDPGHLTALLAGLAARAYAFFRWATTEKFLTSYGWRS